MSEEEIVDCILSGNGMQLVCCEDCGRRYVVFDNKKSCKFPWNEVKPLLQRLLKDKIIQSSKPIRELLSERVVEDEK